MKKRFLLSAVAVFATLGVLTMLAGCDMIGDLIGGNNNGGNNSSNKDDKNDNNDGNIIEKPDDGKNVSSEQLTEAQWEAAFNSSNFQNYKIAFEQTMTVMDYSSVVTYTALVAKPYGLYAMEMSAMEQKRSIQAYYDYNTGTSYYSEGDGWQKGNRNSIEEIHEEEFRDMFMSGYEYGDFTYDSTLKGYVLDPSMSPGGSLVYKFTDGKLTNIIQEYTAVEGGITESSVMHVSLTYGGQSVSIPSSVISAANGGSSSGDNTKPGDSTKPDDSNDKDNTGNGEHTHVAKYKTEGYPATCTEYGMRTYFACEYCGRYFEDEACTVELDPSSVMIPPSHHLKPVAAVEASCIKEGNLAYYICDVCEKWFADADGKKEIIDKSSVVTVVDHKFKDGICTVCGTHEPTAGLEYTDKGSYYAFTGIGTVTDKDIWIAETYNGKPVTAMDDGAFNGADIRSVWIPKTVTNINSFAFFEYSNNFESITVASDNPVYHSVGNCIIETAAKALIAGCKNSVIPGDGSVTSIASYAFSGCRELTSIVIPDSVTEIQTQAFYNCSALTSVTIPDSVTSVGIFVLAGCDSLSSLTLPGADNIFRSLFEAWIGVQLMFEIPDALKTVVVTNGTSVAPQTFEDCDKIERVILPEGMTSISSYAFSNCTSLAQIDLPDTLTSIGYAAFMGCTALTQISLPGELTAIGAYAFRDCTGLTDIYFRGTRQQWNNIDKGADWDRYLNAYTVHCSDDDNS